MFFSLTQISELLIQYKYLILFPIVVVEGPIITVIAGFLASLGYLSFLIAYAVIVAADLTGDAAYYAIGYWGRGQFIEKWGRYVGLKKKSVLRLENHFKNHPGKTLLLGKISHGIGAAFLAAAGLARMPFTEFLWFNFLATIPKSLFLLLIGFYFGEAITRINSYLEFTAMISVGVGLIIVLIYYLYSPKKKDYE